MLAIADSLPNSRSARERKNGSESACRDVLSALLRPCRLQCLRVQSGRLVPPYFGTFSESGPGYLVALAGTCSVRVSGEEYPGVLKPGDFAFFTCAREFTLLRDDLAADGSEVRFVWGALTDDDEYTRQALSLLPPLVMTDSHAGQSAAGVSSLLAVLVGELETRRPGGEFVVERALHSMLVYALRSTPLTLPGHSGLLRALATPGLGTALGAMHARPEHDWSVRELADLAGLSRSKFALRFVEVLGRPPGDYLREVRLNLACQLLRETSRGIKEIAVRVGYATEASFGKAFARWHGCTPGAYRQGQGGHARDAF